MKPVHPINLREELLHSFEVLDSRGRWRQTNQKVIYSTVSKTIVRNGKRKRVQKFRKKKKFRRVILETPFKFRAVRIDGDQVFKLTSFRNRFPLQRLLTWKPFEEESPILKYLNEIRHWVNSQDVSVGGFPLVPYQVITKKQTKGVNPLADIAEDEQLEGYYGLQKAFFDRYGLGQIWQGDKESDTLSIYVGVWTQTGWREYKGEMPRFFVRQLFVDREDLGIEEQGFNLESLEGRQLITDYVLEDSVNKLFQYSKEGGDLIVAPLGIVGWGYGD